ncbi:unnamed protein product [Rangifer tarandus platyrhynchus]|uniref:Uncharacterized protein n=1 Tax=Rangifer tarandus platyrhynchus TaxID=3082113 RepID=A0AC59YZ74_RANTA
MVWIGEPKTHMEGQNSRTREFATLAFLVSHQRVGCASDIMGGLTPRTPLRVRPLVSNEITGGTAGSSGAKPWDCCSSACLPENSWAVFVEGIYGQQGMATTPLGSGGLPAPYPKRYALTWDCGALRGVWAGAFGTM